MENVLFAGDKCVGWAPTGKEYTREIARLETEKIKIYFPLLLASSIGTATLIAKENFGQNTKDLGLLVAGILFDFGLTLLIWRTFRNIEEFLQKLNNPPDDRRN
ncbi:MAG: hypothetical protein H7Z75_13390, partial [Ferruginibacter sp.]|nr:hypothetical protein [Cytophagales bacterium]